jgi:hypothetical protein
MAAKAASTVPESVARKYLPAVARAMRCRVSSSISERMVR